MTLRAKSYRRIRQSIQRVVDNDADLIRIVVNVQKDLRKRGHERARAKS
jgi:DNA-directed RNA polymerase sigma subunit (sigma70/sigma32)